MLWRHSPSNRDILERLESLERRFKTLLADVDEYFHLVRRAENRIVKKSAKMEEPVGNDGGADIVPDVPSPFPSLTPRQAQAQAAIMRRRANLEVKQ